MVPSWACRRRTGIRPSGHGDLGTLGLSDGTPYAAHLRQIDRGDEWIAKIDRQIDRSDEIAAWAWSSGSRLMHAAAM